MTKFSMTERHRARALVLVPLMASGLALAGCVGSPTYGTGTPAGEQLLGDVSNAISLRPAKRDAIDYKPRATLVKPKAGTKEALPAPQDSITQTASGEWPESPEQRRARLRAEATANENNPNYEPGILADDVQTDPVAVRKAMAESGSSHPPPPDSGQTVARRAEVAKRVAESQQSTPTSRRYLTDPPVAYRTASDTAPQGDLGEDEYKKERRLKKEAQAKSGKSGWFDWWN